jgi:dihydrofolate synthase/folylpolyglutamate synthase
VSGLADGGPAAYQEVLDDLFRTFLAAKPLLRGRRDAEIREPRLLVGLADRFGLLPPPERTIRVTGSKGKGSVARFAAAMIGAARPGEPVGLLTSPEEIDHVDRIRVDGAPIPRADLVRLHAWLKPELAALEAGLAPGRYLSPSGQFLLLALAWFRERGVRHVVLEGGRGMLHDEVGWVASKVGVVTTILREHVEHLGPTLDDVAREKLHVAALSEVTVLGPGCARWVGSLAPADAVLVPAPPPSAAAPGWIALDRALAATAVEACLGPGTIVPAALPLPNVPSFGRLEAAGRPLWYEGLIAADSFDAAFWGPVLARGPALVLASLTDDKDVDGVDAAFARLGAPPLHVVLAGERGFLAYGRARAAFGGRVAGPVGYDDGPALRGLVAGLLREHRAELAVAVGTQTFLRLLKQAFVS